MGYKIVEVAKKYGLKTSSGQGGIYDFADIDCDLIAVHHFVNGKIWL